MATDIKVRIFIFIRQRQASVGAALRRVPLEAHVLPLPFLGFNFYQLHSTLTSSDLGKLNRPTETH